MVNSQFGAILKEFEAFFNCTLEPDNNNSCLIRMESGLAIQIELDRYGLLLIGCRVGAIPLSRYRDNLIQEALKSNEASSPSMGVFGFSHKSNQLILFIRVNPERTSQQLITSMPSFIAKAKQWTDAIATGATPNGNQTSSHQAASGLFDLMSS